MVGLEVGGRNSGVGGDRLFDERMGRRIGIGGRQGQKAARGSGARDGGRLRGNPGDNKLDQIATCRLPSLSRWAWRPSRRRGGMASFYASSAPVSGWLVLLVLLLDFLESGLFCHSGRSGVWGWPVEIISVRGSRHAAGTVAGRWPWELMLRNLVKGEIKRKK